MLVINHMEDFHQNSQLDVTLREPGEPWGYIEGVHIQSTEWQHRNNRYIHGKE